MTYTTPVSGQHAFSVGDSITISGHNNPTGYNGTVTVLSRTIGTTTGTITYQTPTVVVTTGNSTANVTITQNSSPYNGTFLVTDCTNALLKVSGTGVLTANSTATISGLRRARTKPIVDSINSRGYLVSGVLPVLTARGMNLAFFPVQ
jgi:hypothetical protein